MLRIFRCIHHTAAGCCVRNGREVIEKLELPGRLLQKMVPSGTPVGMLSPEICEELGVSL